MPRPSVTRTICAREMLLKSSPNSPELSNLSRACSGCTDRTRGAENRYGLAASRRRYYLPADIFRDRLSFRVLRRLVKLETGGWLMGLMGRAMRRANTPTRWKTDSPCRTGLASTLVITASIIAAVRLARDDISQPPSNVAAVVADSVALARMIPDRVARLA
jgi:hypothetical protein